MGQVLQDGEDGCLTSLPQLQHNSLPGAIFTAAAGGYIDIGNWLIHSHPFLNSHSGAPATYLHSPKPLPTHPPTIHLTLICSRSHYFPQINAFITPGCGFASNKGSPEPRLSRSTLGAAK